MQVVCYFGKAARQGKVALPTDSLLAASEEFARRNELTGLLTISDGYFLHVLEGDDAAVQSLVPTMAQVASDAFAHWRAPPPPGSSRRRRKPSSASL